MFLRQISDSSLAQNAYLIGCERTGDAIIVDPERDVDRYLKVAGENDLRIVAVAETHIHADYLSGARELAERHGATVYLSGEGGADWQFEWAKGLGSAVVLRDGDEFRIGGIGFRALLTPGHTPEHLGFLVTDHGSGADTPMALLSGDFLFVGDVGRPDLLESAAGQAGSMEPAAKSLFASLRQLGDLPGHLQVLPGHGAGSACGKSLGAVPWSVLAYERATNPALRLASEGTEERFVREILTGQPEPPRYFARMKRDNRMGPPLLPEGRLPAPHRLAPHRLRDWVGAPGRAILHLRSDRSAFLRHHLRGSLLAPLHGGRLPIVVGSYLEESSRILLLVEHEEQVDEAVRQLVRIGLDRVEAWLTASEALQAADLLESVPSIAPAELPAGATVLDVRGASEHAAAHLAGATNIAYTRLAARLDEVPAAKPLHVHCAGGTRAAIASAFLASRGHDVVQVDGRFADFPESLKRAEPQAR